jgi:hypothetical protein
MPVTVTRFGSQPLGFTDEAVKLSDLALDGSAVHVGRFPRRRSRMERESLCPSRMPRH